MIFALNLTYGQTVIIYGDKNYPPYSYLENGENKGIYVEVVKKAFKKMKDYTVIIKLGLWSEVFSKVKKGRGVGIFPPFFKKERTKILYYSEPLVQEQVVVFGTAKKLNGKTKWPEDFYNTNIGLNSGFGYDSMGGKAFLKAYNDGKLEISESRNNKLNLEKVNSNRIDYYLNDRLINISDYPKIKRGVVAVSNYGYLCFTKNTERYPFIPKFKKQFDDAIKELKANNEIDEIIKKYTK
jgi:polar amino acid transport system substrate-binding protein